MDGVPSFKEDHISQVPGLQLLQGLGYTYLTPDEALALRGGRRSAVLLEGILADQLARLNKIRYKGSTYAFSEANIQASIQALRDITYDGLVRTSEKVYELVTLGRSLAQTIGGDTKSFPFRYIDFDRAEDNVFHVTEEFEVERQGSYEARRPDIVLFVNGIPLVVIECKSPHIKDPIEQAVSQQLRNQRDDEIPLLFVYSQLLLAITKNEGEYGTTGTPARFWSVWRERDDETGLRALVNRPLTEEQKRKLFASRFRYVRRFFDQLEAGGREVTEQDRALYALCRPGRLLELTYRYMLFDAGVKKIARYQQYFCVRKLLERVKRADESGTRSGGVVWHTQGSGKSLTMVLLAQAIALEPAFEDFKIVLVTDRVDLDDQIYRTFQHCGAEVVQARTGRHLAELLSGQKQRIIATIIDKFEAALGRSAVRNDSPNIFALVDEGHRGQYGALHGKMRRVLPNACFLAFTGTPVIKREKNTIVRFGGLIDTYTITQAVEDRAVVPLLYEGRHVDQLVDHYQIDTWFDRVSEPLSVEQKADLKRKFSTTDQLNKARQKVARVAYDISTHFRDNWKGTGFKAQLVTQDKATALLYKECLDETGVVTSEVLVSGPDEREGYDEVDAPAKDAVVTFWKRMMNRYGSEREYNRQLINAFTKGEEPEVIIVVDKLLTGFDAPRNTVLYLTRTLKDHQLLQAIARVNRVYEGKEYGYVIDYRGVLTELDHALALYGDLAAFEQADLEGTITNIQEVSRLLPQRHSDVWDVFSGVRNKQDEEALERALADESARSRFYERLSLFARSLAIALSTLDFVRKTPEERVGAYKRDLAVFMKLRSSVRRRYAEVVDFREYEPRIQKLIDTHVGTGEVEKLTSLVNIFDSEAFAKEVEQLTGAASKADTIAFRTKRTIHERMDEDPAFYKRFSEMLEDAIRAFREERLSELDYLRRVSEISRSVRNRTGDDIPPVLEQRPVAKAYYGIVAETLRERARDGLDVVAVAAEVAFRIEESIERHRIVHWSTNTDVQNRMRNEIEDLLFDLKERQRVELTIDDIDRVMERCLDIARVRRA